MTEQFLIAAIDAPDHDHTGHDNPDPADTRDHAAPDDGPTEEQRAWWAAESAHEAAEPRSREFIYLREVPGQAE